VSFPVQKSVEASRSDVYYFKHNDMEDLERVILKQIEKESQVFHLIRRTNQIPFSSKLQTTNCELDVNQFGFKSRAGYQHGRHVLAILFLLYFIIFSINSILFLSKLQFLNCLYT